MHVENVTCIIIAIFIYITFRIPPVRLDQLGQF